MKEVQLIYNLPEECNSNCIFCDYQFNKHIKPQPKIDYRLIEDYLKLNVGRSISLGGGEPLIYEYLPELVDYCYDNEIKINVTTNGKLLENFSLKTLSKMTNIIISLHAIDKNIYDKVRLDGSYEEVFAGVRRCINDDELHDKTTILSVINSLTIDHIVDFCIFALNNRLKISLTPQFRFFNSYEKTSEILHLFDIDLKKILEIKPFLVEYKIMSNEYVEEIYNHFQRCQLGLFDTMLNRSICDMRMIKRYPDGSWGCFSGTTDTDIDRLRLKIRTCRMSCGINPCICRCYD